MKGRISDYEGIIQLKNKTLTQGKEKQSDVFLFERIKQV